MIVENEIAVVYMVAGISSRFGGKIKQFAKVGPKGETLIEYSVNQALKAGFNKIIFIVGDKTVLPFKELFGVDFKGVPVVYTKQSYDCNLRDKPWGTCDAVCSALPAIDKTRGFVICNGDDIYGEKTFKKLIEHIKNPDNKNICACIGYKLSEVLTEEGTSRAMFIIDDLSYVQSLEEKFNVSKETLQSLGLNENDLCSMNIFALNPEAVKKLSKILLDFKKKNNGNRRVECLLPTEISNLIKSKEILMKLYESVDKWTGVTYPTDEEIVREQLKSLN